jgi:hypothetical protein
MPHVTIEHVIMIPVLILQIFLFPLATSFLMNVWVDSRRTLALQEMGSNMGSSIQQMYFTLNHPTVPEETSTEQLGLPSYIDGYYFTAKATIQASDFAGSSQILEITLTLATTNIEVTSSAILGSNAQWDATTTFVSNSTNASVYAEKFQNGTIQLGFGG